MKIIVVLLAISSIITVYAEEEITQFLGFELGKTITPIELKTLSAQKVQFQNKFKIPRAKRTFRKFIGCTLNLDQKQRIRTIKSTYYAKTEKEAKEEFIIIDQLLRKKYKLFMSTGLVSFFQNKTKTRTIQIARTAKKIEITYYDRTKYENQEPDKQKIQKEIEQTNTSGI